MKRNIRQVTILGSGTMGAQIACHFANIGCSVLLLDIPPRELTEEEKKKNLSLQDPKVRNRIVNQNLRQAAKLNPSPLYEQDSLNRISTGNFEDDMPKIAQSDWIIEAIVEKKNVKMDLYEKVEEHREKDTIISTNTSGIPIHALLENRSSDFKTHFLGTHFFNPPRYLELLEIIPSRETKPELVDFVQHYGSKMLGKTTVVCKDTPAFIGNRIGVYATMLTIDLMQKIGLSVEEIDAITGKFVGRPKSATFRTADLVGLDILADVAQGVHENAPQDEERAVFKLPAFFQQMLDQGWLGEKTGQGFYKKVKDEDGESKILALDLEKMEYQAQDKPKFAIIEEIKKKASTEDKLESFEEGDTSTVSIFKKLYYRLFGSSDDKAVHFFREFYYRLFAYCSHRIPEITDDLYKIDRAIKAGFGWEFGPFETWDILGFQDTYQQMQKAGHLPADWVHTMVNKKITSFYEVENSQRRYYDQLSGKYKLVPGTDQFIFLNNYRKDRTVFSNAESRIIDIGEGVLLVEFTSKSNAIGMELMAGIQKALDLAESSQTEYQGVVIGNEADDFSVGANLGMIAMNAFKGNMEEVGEAITMFQATNRRLRYAPVPVVSATHGKALGGGAEIAMYSDGVQAAAETYLGLVEFGAGLIPAGGGSTEFARRASHKFVEGDPKTHHLQHHLMTIAQAKTARSAHQAFDLGFLQAGRDQITLNRHHIITEAKQRVLEMLQRGYTPPREHPVPVLGRNGLSFFYMAIGNMRYGHYITDYEQEIARKLAYVMCGGDVSGEVEVSEEYLLRLEKEAFLELIQNKKTLKRIESLLKTGKPLRN